MELAANLPAGERYRIEASNDIDFATNHEAVPTLKSPHATARSTVDIMNAIFRELSGASDVVSVAGITAINHNIAFGKVLDKFIQGILSDSRRQHKPDGSWSVELGHKVPQRCRAGHAFTFERLHGYGVDVVHHTVVSIMDQPANEVLPHSSDAHHPKLHRSIGRHAEQPFFWDKVSP